MQHKEDTHSSDVLASRIDPALLDLRVPPRVEIRTSEAVSIVIQGRCGENSSVFKLYCGQLLLYYY